MEGSWRDILRAFGLAVLVHLGFLALLVLGTLEWPSSRPKPVITARLVDATPLVEQRRAERQAEEAAERERQAELERQRREAEAEQQRQEQAERERREAAERRRQAELEEQRRREAERERQAELERQRRQAAEQRRREEQEALERERERQRREEAERQERLEELRRQREAAEQRRREQEQRLEALAEQREREEAERQAREQAERERQAREAAERQAAAAAQAASLRQEYIGAIRAQVTQNWIRPPTAESGLRCELRVFQIPGGEVISAEIASPCNADAATRRSIQAAVMRAGNLPYRGYEDVFERQIQFTFSYDE